MRRAGKTMARRTARTTLQRRPSETWSPAHAAADGDITKTYTGRPDSDAARRPFVLRPGTKGRPVSIRSRIRNKQPFAGIRLSGRAAHTATARRGLSADERSGEARRGTRARALRAGAVTFHWKVAALIVFLGGLGLLFDDIPRGARP